MSTGMDIYSFFILLYTIYAFSETMHFFDNANCKRAHPKGLAVSELRM